MKKQKFFAVRKTKNGSLERIETEGYKAELNGFAFFVSGGSGFSWSVTEAKSGMNIGIYGKTKKEVLEKLQAFDTTRLDRFDLDKLHNDMMKLPIATP